MHWGTTACEYSERHTRQTGDGDRRQGCVDGALNVVDGAHGSGSKKDLTEVDPSGSVNDTDTSISLV